MFEKEEVIMSNLIWTFVIEFLRIRKSLIIQKIEKEIMIVVSYHRSIL